MARLPVLCYADIDSLTCSRATFHIPALIIFDHVPLRQFYIMQELHLVTVLWSSDVLLSNEQQPAEVFIFHVSRDYGVVCSLICVLDSDINQTTCRGP
jgi:hypothetical protein